MNNTEHSMYQIEEYAKKKGGEIHHHYWSDTQGLRLILFDEQYEFNGQQVESKPLGLYDIRCIHAGWIGNCHSLSGHHEESQGQVNILDQLGIRDLNVRHNIALLNRPIMTAVGRKFGRNISPEKLYKLPNPNQVYQYYSSTEIFRTKTDDVKLEVTFSRPTYKGQSRIEHEGASSFTLYRLGPGLLDLIASWEE